ncbi:hypothetical protein I601_2042 [Nocardioides dokdonensis FR1436]|uniref:Uncharacterized protein n=1 Tax=Nocardioides dokdonensis FR1436 TaxID=1300347 RepID=A0A1A9GLB3_9ACTN|nr:DUF1707 domain-containing protein [Nocardioides dokdonensis]ANH38470.1 hypothetical protein I601_2042 [Nocardioides dokdonensis FR1436]
MGEMEEGVPGPSRSRVSHADRERVAEVLRVAKGEGRLDLDELGERLDLTWGAKTYADLVPITHDLQTPDSIVPAQHTAFALMGSVVLDLRQAVLESHETRIQANAVMGDVKVLVPAHVHVVVDGMPVMGDYGQGKDKVPADLGPESPVVRVQGVALMGSVQVRRLPPPGTPKKYLGTY